MPTLSWFPMPVYIDRISGHAKEQVDDELYAVFDKAKFAQNPQWTNDTNELSVTNNSFFSSHELEDCKVFNSCIDYHLKKYLQELSTPTNLDYFIDNSWLTKTNKGKYIHLHDHGNYDVSGVYYLKTNGKDGALYFPSPYRLMAGNFILSRVVDYYQHLPLENGLLALWPSVLLHNTEVNTTDHERISASFNIKFRS
tara:strand:+ start:2800 stop:3390 length:591 start_codon:yes stop_codon:yes gene_type:complete